MEEGETEWYALWLYEKDLSREEKIARNRDAFRLFFAQVSFRHPFGDEDYLERYVTRLVDEPDPSFPPHLQTSTANAFLTALALRDDA